MLLSQLSEPDTDFKIKQNYHENQPAKRNNTVERNTPLNSTNNPIQVNGPQVICTHLRKGLLTKYEGNLVV